MNINNLDISNIQEGMVIKNYKKLCELLNQPVLTSNSKKAQLKEFERYFSYTKDEYKNVYVILEIYEKPLPSNVAANSKYLQFIQDILLFYLAELDQRVVYKGKNELLQILGVINNKYIYKRDNREELIELVDAWEIDEFYQRCDAKLYNILETSLKSLKKRCLIDYSDSYKICYLYNGEEHYRTANNIEHSFILKTKRDVLTSMGFESEYQVYFNPDVKKGYYREVNKRLQEEYEWVRVYQCYKIIYDPDNAIKAIDKDIERYKLNTLFKDAIDKQAEDKYNNSISKGYTLPPNYIQMQKLLSNELIKLSSLKNIV